MEYSIVGETAPFRLCTGYSVEVGGFLPVTTATKVSLYREISTLSSCETPRHFTNAMAPFSALP